MRKLVKLELWDIVPFKDHPFKVERDESFKELLESIKDNYPKYVLTMDKFDFSQNGIIHKNVIDWLLEE